MAQSLSAVLVKVENSSLVTVVKVKTKMYCLPLKAVLFLVVIEMQVRPMVKNVKLLFVVFCIFLKV